MAVAGTCHFQAPSISLLIEMALAGPCHWLSASSFMAVAGPCHFQATSISLLIELAVAGPCHWLSASSFMAVAGPCHFQAPSISPTRYLGTVQCYKGKEHRCLLTPSFCPDETMGVRSQDPDRPKHLPRAGDGQGHSGTALQSWGRCGPSRVGVQRAYNLGVPHTHDSRDRERWVIGSPVGTSLGKWVV